MEFIEVIGFLIMVLALLLPLARRFFEKRMRQRDPAAYQQAQERARQQVREMQRALGYADEEEEKEWEAPVTPPLPPVRISERHIRTGIAEKTLIEQSAPALHAAAPLSLYPPPSRAKRLVGQRRSLRDMVVLHEILSSPLALRDSHDAL